MHFNVLLTFLDDIRVNSTSEFDKGYRFENLIKQWLQTDARYKNNLEKVWLWSDFPARDQFGGHDLGIDIVARTVIGRYWAIQCKCYDKNTPISKESVDSFIACSARHFIDPVTNEDSFFDERLWISTGESFGRNAEQMIKGHENFKIIDLADLSHSEIDWEALIKGKPQQKEAKEIRPHQQEAVKKARAYFSKKDASGNFMHDRGKMIMACGTGKTLTALKIVEDQIPSKEELGHLGSVLFLSPSISLVNQSLNAWMNDCTRNIQPLGVCSDPTATTRHNEDSFEELFPNATTDPEKLAQDYLAYTKKGDADLLVIFSTYQSIKKVYEAQRKISQQVGYEHCFDFVICDEAHRTTGIFDTNADQKEKSSFLQIHDANYIKAKKRLYMTATPKIYGETAKATAKNVQDKDYELCSMDDSSLYGEEFYRLGFGEAVLNNLLTDYKVLVLTIGSTSQLPDAIVEMVEDGNIKELPFESAARLAGCVSALGKNIFNNPTVWDLDPQIMRRAILFCDRIGKVTQDASSKHSAYYLPDLAEKCFNGWQKDTSLHKVKVEARHIDGGMGGNERIEALQWLEQGAPDSDTCRVLCNVRCLGEGIDVPALDAAIFLSSKKSPIDVVQAVGRVMRNFRQGQENGKKFGYIIIPIVINPNVSLEDALNKSEYKRVWDVLRALRSHDERVNPKINTIGLDNKTEDSQFVIGTCPFPRLSQKKKSTKSDSEQNTDQNTVQNADQNTEPAPEQNDLAKLLKDWFAMEKGAKILYAKMVEKVGSLHYWERWAKDIQPLAENLIFRITELIEKSGEHQRAFAKFLHGLEETVGVKISQDRAVEMLAQHMITRPVFEALFADYHFVSNNAVSKSMEGILEVLRQVGLEKDLAKLDDFYKSIKINLGSVETLDGKQTIIKKLYDSFFQVAFPKAADQLGIVYTPVECVDFILRSVEDVLHKDLNASLTDEDVHILDPFTGTGTFITRLLQSGMIKKEDMERKYLHEIHCNELVLLAYYVADVNIENTFHALMDRKDYLFYNGICFTDTFTLGRNQRTLTNLEFFKTNSENMIEQEKTRIQVIIGNPPYSIGQRKTDDDAKNVKYLDLDKRIAETYVAASSAATKRSLYDSYIRAFRWASDRLKKDNKNGGVIGFITNAGWLDGNAAAGFRACLEKEFSSIYVLDLRGAIRAKSREQALKEGGNVFNIMTGVCIVILVDNPDHEGKATIYYHDIGDYLSRQQKFTWLHDRRSLKNVDWITLTPDKHNDWIHQRTDIFSSLIGIGDKKNKNDTHTFFESYYSLGVITSRDAWCCNFSKKMLEKNIKCSIEFYNHQCDLIKDGREIFRDPTQFSWTYNAESDAHKGKKYNFEKDSLRKNMYRPFTRQYVYFSHELNERVYQIPQLFPTPEQKNLLICVSGIGAQKDFSCLITDCIPNLDLLEKAQCFPRYYYVEREKPQNSLLAEKIVYDARDGITDFILNNIRSRFGNTQKITKEKIFYYVYGILHSPEYRQRFQNDLKKSLPRIPIVEKIEDFLTFAKAGEELANLHLHYESQIPLPQMKINDIASDKFFYEQRNEQSESPEKKDGNFTVEKMRFAGKAGNLDKSTILFNSEITISNIPLRAYDYVVNGRSAIEWIMESYRVKTDKDSGIVNDPNTWAEEQGKPRYLLDLLLSVITVSMKTLDIVEKLPKLDLPESERSEADKQ